MRPASELTVAIRSLLKKTGGEITHKQARVELKKMGHPIARAPKRKSKELTTVESYNYDTSVLNAALRGKNSDGEEISSDEANKVIAEVLEPVWLAEPTYTDEMKAAVVAEMKRQLTYRDEANFFNVTKNIWSQDATPISRRPQKVVTPRKSVVATASSSDDQLALVEKLGGVAAVETKLKDMQTELDRLSAAVEHVRNLKKRLQEAA